MSRVQNLLVPDHMIPLAIPMNEGQVLSVGTEGDPVDIPVGAQPGQSGTQIQVVSSLYCEGCTPRLRMPGQKCDSSTAPHLVRAHHHALPISPGADEQGDFAADQVVPERHGLTVGHRGADGDGTGSGQGTLLLDEWIGRIACQSDPLTVLISSPEDDPGPAAKPQVCRGPPLHATQHVEIRYMNPIVGAHPAPGSGQVLPLPLLIPVHGVAVGQQRQPLHQRVAAKLPAIHDDAVAGLRAPDDPECQGAVPKHRLHRLTRPQGGLEDSRAFRHSVPRPPQAQHHHQPDSNRHSIHCLERPLSSGCQSIPKRPD